jgi:predicted nuclease of predicted toxin-antitoxin system
MDPAVAEGLRRRGIDVTTTVEAGLMGAADEEQLTYSTANGRVFVTRDRHFLVLHSQRVSHAGIAYWHLKRRNVGRLVLDLTLLWRAVAAEDVQGRVEYL